MQDFLRAEKELMKKKMDPTKKIKLIFFIEYIAIAIIVITVAILRMTGVISYSSRRVDIFNWITIFGGSWIIIDAAWAIFSSYRRKKTSLLDKLTLLPLGIYLVIFDISCFAGGKNDTYFTLYGVCAALLYVGVVYLFQGIYHYYYPTPQVLELIKQDEEEKKKKALEAEVTSIETKEEKKDIE